MLAGKDRTAMHRIKLEYLQVTSGVGLQSVASVCLNIAGEKFEAALPVTVLSMRPLRL